ncbi:MAG: hypothetical protein LBF80_05605 [Spirochaetaceae bacterium]|jgi:hypothetical protein|nr:hypothetical protein [Spirochaetaceae bacterium]
MGREKEKAKDGTFALPGKKKLKRKSESIQYVVVDVTESPINRPKRVKRSTIQEKKQHTLKTPFIVNAPP